MTGDALEIRTPCPALEPALAEFFGELQNSGAAARFHPHPLTAAEAARLCRHSGEDLYYLLTAGREVLGYGMLRGWEEGHAVPALGIALRASARGRGLATLLMQFLHGAARWRGARRIMLKVEPDNLPALRLYERLGYHFGGESDGQLLGTIEL